MPTVGWMRLPLVPQRLAPLFGHPARRRAGQAQRLLRAHIAQSKTEVRHITLDRLYRARRRA